MDGASGSIRSNCGVFPKANNAAFVMDSQQKAWKALERRGTKPHAPQSPNLEIAQVLRTWREEMASLSQSSGVGHCFPL